MPRVYEKLESQVLPRELEDIGLENTPQYDLYEDEKQNDQTFPQQLIGAEIVAQSHDTSGNVMERAHTNTILDGRVHWR